MGKDKVNWEYVNEWKKEVNPLGRKEEFKAISIPFGLPEVVDPYGTRFGIDVEVLPKWNIPRKVLICQTVCYPGSSILSDDPDGYSLICPGSGAGGGGPECFHLTRSRNPLLSRTGVIDGHGRTVYKG
ncbi:MAG: hypothetical protein HY879_00310 [Deltaproteobacteria bacterium]|nr:hypothetical protein [Deltaproteobacteria bacterium]